MRSRLSIAQTAETKKGSEKMDLIYKQSAINATWFEPVYRDPLNVLSEVRDRIESLPSAEPALYGYKIEHLAYIAKVMEKEGVTAEYAVRTFDDISRAVKMVLDEAQRKVEEVLNG